jgi:uncharacterized protein YbbK (DUF523 family)
MGCNTCIWSYCHVFGQWNTFNKAKTNKTDRHDITEILLKGALNTTAIKNQTTLENQIVTNKSSEDTRILIMP